MLGSFIIRQELYISTGWVYHGRGGVVGAYGYEGIFHLDAIFYSYFRGEGVLLDALLV